MSSHIAKCGNDCSSCPWSIHLRNRLSSEEWETFRAGVKKYVGIAIQDLKPCHGCQTPTEKLAKDVGVHNYLRGCLARKCALYNGIENCAYCSRFPCYQIESMSQIYNREAVEERLGEPVPEDAYEKYLEPFQGMRHLEKIRSELEDTEIVEMKPVTEKKGKITSFPEGIKSEDRDSYREIHSLITGVSESSLALSDIDTFAVSEQLKKRRKGVFQLLWVLGLYGAVKGNEMELDSISYFENKFREMPSTLSSMHQYFEILQSFGLRGELVSLNEGEWLLPSGFLRSRARKSRDPVWEMHFTYRKPGFFKNLKHYTEALYDKSQNRGLIQFRKADMRILT
jgi:hypothetical protein